MNILIISYYYPPIKTGGTLRPEKTAKYLRKFGYNVTVLTHSYKENDFKKDIIRIFDISFNKYRKGLRYFIWLFFRTVSGFLNLIGLPYSIYTLWKNSVIRKSDQIVALVEPDLLLVTYPPVETLEIGLFLSKKFCIPLVSDFRDGLLFEPIESQLIKRSNTMKKFYGRIEKKTAENSIFIMTVSDPITEYFKNVYKIENVLTIYTGYDPDDYIDISNESLIGDKNIFKIVFTGRLSLSDSSNQSGFFFDAVYELLRDNVNLVDKIRIYMAGEFNDDELKPLKGLIDKGVLVNCGYINRSDAIKMQWKADLLLIITSITRSSIVTTKIFEYLKSTKPILALTYKTELEKIIIDTKTGWVVHPQNKELIKKMIYKIIKDKMFLNSFNPDIRKISFYSIEVQMRILDVMIKKTLKFNQNKEGK